MGAIEGSGQRRECPDSGVHRLLWPLWGSGQWGTSVGAEIPGWRHLRCPGRRRQLCDKGGSQTGGEGGWILNRF